MGRFMYIFDVALMLFSLPPEVSNHFLVSGNLRGLAVKITDNVH